MKSKLAKVQDQKANGVAGTATLTERLRKVRALSCNPSDVGMDSYVDWLTRYGNAYFIMTNMIK